MSSLFTPLNPGLYTEKSRWNPSQIGFQIDSYVHGKFPDIDYSEIVMFNVPEYEGTDNSIEVSDCKVRDAFYRLYFDKIPKISDLGTIKLEHSRQENYKLITEVCVNLLHKGIIPLIIGGGQDISYAVYKAYSELEKTITLCCVDSSFDIGMPNDKLKSNSFLSKIISYKPNHLFNFINLGYQTFFVKPEELDLLEGLNFELNRLGNIRSDISLVEPYLRNSDFVSFDLSSISSSYFISNVYSTPNGFDANEACSISRYAGISDKVTCFGIFEYNQMLDQNNQGSQLISQMIWYFLEGYKSRKHELNPIKQNCIKYTVAFDDDHTQIDFYKSKNSGRWWMGVPFKNLDKENSNVYFVSCSYLDYQTASKGEVPERWIKTYNRFL